LSGGLRLHPDSLLLPLKLEEHVLFEITAVYWRTLWPYI